MLSETQFRELMEAVVEDILKPYIREQVRHEVELFVAVKRLAKDPDFYKELEAFRIDEGI